VNEDYYNKINLAERPYSDRESNEYMDTNQTNLHVVDDFLSLKYGSEGELKNLKLHDSVNEVL